jgi:hypothetical protein
MEVGEIIRTEIAKNRDGDKDVLLLHVSVSEEEDIRTVELMNLSGDDTHPLVGARVLFDEAAEAWSVALSVDDLTVPQVEAGEREIYSLSGTTKKAKVKLVKDGTIKLNDGTDWAVQFTALQLAFEQLKAELNAHILNFNTHVHSPTPVGIPPMIPPPPVPSVSAVADMSGAKVDTVRIP